MPELNFEEIARKLARANSDTELLRCMLQSVMRVFKPRTSNETVEFTFEWIQATSKIAAYCIAETTEGQNHICSDCAKSTLAITQEVMRDTIIKDYQRLAELAGFEDLLVEPDTNTKTRNEILDEIDDASWLVEKKKCDG